MRCVERPVGAFALVLFAWSAQTNGESSVLVHAQRYAMGTMFDVVAYHPSRRDAQHAIDGALDEVVRLDRIMSHYDATSELARVHRAGRSTALTIDPGLYEVVRQSLEMSRRSAGRFDITIAPLLRAWKTAAAQGRHPDAAERARARQCVGYENIELVPPDRIRLRSACVEIDLGGIGKGYAVDRALHILKAAGVANAVVNAGGSSIAAIGAPPHRNGWPVLLGSAQRAPRTLLLRGASISTSLQDAPFGEIIDPLSGAPVASRTAVTVVAQSASLGDALSTTLVVLPIEEGKRLLAQFEGVAAVWISPEGDVHTMFGESHLALADAH